MPASTAPTLEPADDLASAEGRALLRDALTALATAVAPVARVPVSVWAERERVVPPESGSPRPGPWRNAVVPYLTEIMDVADLEHPSSEVVVMGSAQTGKSEIGLNVLGAMIAQDPGPALVVLPSLEEAKKYVNVKFSAMVEATECLKATVKRPTSGVTEPGSTTFYKRFAGGFAVVTTASSSKGLQMISARLRIFEEVSGYPIDVDGRGSPVQQANARAKAWFGRGSKAIYISTPGIAGQCEITSRYAVSDQRRWYCRCPHCGAYQAIRWERLRWAERGGRLEAWYECAASGCVVSAEERATLIGSGVWIATYDGGADDPPPPEVLDAADVSRWRARQPARNPGYHIWQGISPFVPWEATVAEYLAAQQRGYSAMKVFWQQALGEPWEERGEAPDAQRLMDRRQACDPGLVPDGVLFLVGATDVQARRLEWAVWGFDRWLAPHLVDWGVIEGDAAEEAVWSRHDDLLSRRWRNAKGRLYSPVRWGIDAGYLSTRVYAYARRHANSGRVMALDGRPGWKHPPIGQPRQVKFKVAGAQMATLIYPVGTYDLKAEIYSRVRQTVDAASSGELPRGAMRLPETVSIEYVRQLVSEHLVERQKRSGEVVREWVRMPGQRNEALDVLVYATAIAHHETAAMSQASWDRLADAIASPVEGEGDVVGGAGGVGAQSWPSGGGAAMVGREKPRSRDREPWLRIDGRWL